MLIGCYCQQLLIGKVSIEGLHVQDRPLSNRLQGRIGIPQFFK